MSLRKAGKIAIAVVTTSTLIGGLALYVSGYSPKHLFYMIKYDVESNRRGLKKFDLNKSTEGARNGDVNDQHILLQYARANIGRLSYEQKERLYIALYSGNNGANLYNITSFYTEYGRCDKASSVMSTFRQETENDIFLNPIIKDRRLRSWEILHQDLLKANGEYCKPYVTVRQSIRSSGRPYSEADLLNLVRGNDGVCGHISGNAFYWSGNVAHFSTLEDLSGGDHFVNEVEQENYKSICVDERKFAW